jgi:hypothetical protein
MTQALLLHCLFLTLLLGVSSVDPSSIPVAVVTCCNSESLNLTISSLKNATGFSPNQLFVFQDAVGKYDDVDLLLSQWIDGDILPSDHLFHHKHGTEQVDYHVLIARAYKHMFEVFFGLPQQYDHLIVLEDDLIVSTDFLEYFAATAPLLHDDPTLFSISAWNDHGFEGMVSTHQVMEPGYAGIHRADHFPGDAILMSHIEPIVYARR